MSLESKVALTKLESVLAQMKDAGLNKEAEQVKAATTSISKELWDALGVIIPRIGLHSAISEFWSDAHANWSKNIKNVSNVKIESSKLTFEYMGSDKSVFFIDVDLGDSMVA